MDAPDPGWRAAFPAVSSTRMAQRGAALLLAMLIMSLVTTLAASAP